MAENTSPLEQLLSISRTRRQITVEELAREVGKSPLWVSLIVNSDGFRHQLEKEPECRPQN